MKYRTDFVTNSSSSSFAAAAITTLAGILASFNCTGVDPEQQDPDKEEGGDDEVFFQKTMMPDGASKLVAGGEPVFLYAQMCTMTKEGVVVLPEPTGNITFQVSKGGRWVSLGNMELLGEWAAVDATGVMVENNEVPPDKVTIKASCIFKKKRYSVNFNLAFEAEAAMEVKPLKCNFLSKSGETASFDVKIKNPGPDPWIINPPDMDTWAAKISNANMEDISDKGDKATLKVTECDTEETSGGSTDHYTKGKIVITGSNGTKEVTDYCEVYVWREGLFRLETSDFDRETGAVLLKADKNEDGSMKTSTFDLRYMRWNAETKALKCDTAIFATEEFTMSDPDPKDDGAEAIFESANAVVKYEGERPSNLPSGKFSIQLDKVIPGKKGERYRFSLTATIDDGLDYFDVEIPIAILPAYLSESKGDWQQEYDYCKKIINSFFPESKRPAKLAELEDCKHYMGVDDLKMYRKETWNIAQDIILKKRDDYLNDAAWYDWALYTAEWVQWLNDRAFNVVAGSLTGPMGVIVATQCKELIQDLIAKYVMAKSTDTWMGIVYDLLYNRFSSTLGGAVDAKYFADPEMSKKWIACFFMYKWAFHWAFDYEGNERKGCIEGAKAACWDLTGAGLEEKLKPIIKDMATKGNFNQSMAIDDYITKTIESMKPYIGSVMNSEFVKSEKGSGA